MFQLPLWQDMKREGIHQVVAIAATHPDYPIILQWTGGHAGGHRSCEDFHQPILSTYTYIRQHKNIVLLAGSGFSGVEDTWPNLSGEWSANMFSVQPMPFNSFLFALWAMVVKEAHTSESVKQLIVNAEDVKYFLLLLSAPAISPYLLSPFSMLTLKSGSRRLVIHQGV
jgi:fatty acid synthase subunit beta